ncbi:MAG: hypothetical protein HYW06_04205 [Gemmatimonadetes bacterium]|nr:hypothetical protein [Gemmatimonadota bacterium]MBI2404046.1 hypothetical protein [Gemmatimonadota bacterium]MBI2536166.1 hypothetical protein [Gemmatimonadota bacterium]MBI2615037.1 hypothetical protein [Gemmatimonadota bacterium]
MISPRYAALVAALLALGACVHSEVFRLDTGVRPATDPASILLLGKEPEQSYTVVGLVSAWSGWGMGRVSKRLRREAARIGGQALLFDSESLAEAQGNPRLSAKVIVFDRPPPAKPPSK